MNLPLARMYRLAPRGGGGLACDNAGVALGAVLGVLATLGALRWRGAPQPEPS